MAREDTRSFAGEGMPFSMAYMVIQDNQSADFQFLGASLSQGDGATSRRVRLHRHAHYEVVFVLEGEFVQHLENGEFRYRAGDVVFLNRNVRHSEGYESDCVLVFVNLSPQLAEDCSSPRPTSCGPGRPSAAGGLSSSSSRRTAGRRARTSAGSTWTSSPWAARARPPRCWTPWPRS